jgi:hypothetical protein
MSPRHRRDTSPCPTVISGEGKGIYLVEGAPEISPGRPSEKEGDFPMRHVEV